MWSVLDQSWFAATVQTSSWLYPLLLTVHGLGMALVVGITMVVALRVLGFPGDAPLGGYLATWPYLAGAFFFNALTGVWLFVADATSLATNPSFQIKLVAIAFGLLSVSVMYRKGVIPAARLEAAGPDGALAVVDPPATAKAAAILSILIWSLSVIVSGRLIAYITPQF